MFEENLRVSRRLPAWEDSEGENEHWQLSCEAATHSMKFCEVVVNRAPKFRE